jgi:aerobic carbon-monoxide dehydrogenase large subunit
MGAYLSTFASCIPTILHATLLAGQYKTPKIWCEVKAVFTNTAPVDAYRGAGRPEATYLLERIVETAANEMGIDPAEIRRRNFITEFPYATPVGLTYDTGDYNATMTRAIELADVAGFAARKAASAAKGLKRGIGYAAYIEACGIAPSSVAGAGRPRRPLRSRRGARAPHGQGDGVHRQPQPRPGPRDHLRAGGGRPLGIPMDDVSIEHGDTGKILFGMGTYGSRSLAVGGTAIVKALDKIIAKGKKIAAHLMEASDSDIVFEDGLFKVAGTDKNVPFASVSLTAYVPHNFPHDKLEPGLNENAFYDPSNFTYPAGTYICEVESTRPPARRAIERFTAVDDFGNVVNPMIVEGQVHGGLAQGIGQALLEHGVYDNDSGQLLTGSYMDYAMPRADDVPSFTVETAKGTPCTHNPLGVKGCGEAGAIGSPPAVINAICNALGVKDVPMPATPHTVWKAAHGKL